MRKCVRRREPPLERLSTFGQKGDGTILGFLLFFGVAFAPILRPSTLIESEAIAETAPIRSRFFLRGSKLLSARVRKKSSPRSPRPRRDRRTRPPTLRTSPTPIFSRPARSAP